MSATPSPSFSPSAPETGASALATGSAENSGLGAARGDPTAAPALQLLDRIGAAEPEGHFHDAEVVQTDEAGDPPECLEPPVQHLHHPRRPQSTGPTSMTELARKDSTAGALSLLSQNTAH